MNSEVKSTMGADCTPKMYACATVSPKRTRKVATDVPASAESSAIPPA